MRSTAGAELATYSLSSAGEGRVIGVRQRQFSEAFLIRRHRRGGVGIHTSRGGRRQPRIALDRERAITSVL